MEEKFKDSALSPKERAEDLLPRLTLARKGRSGESEALRLSELHLQRRARGACG